jgi:hypothetical protein
MDSRLDRPQETPYANAETMREEERETEECAGANANTRRRQWICRLFRRLLEKGKRA